jgi:hypothetical protein
MQSLLALLFSVLLGNVVAYTYAIPQLAFIVTDENFNETFRFCELIKPNNWIIPNEKFWIDNGYSTEINLEKGIDMFDALDIFCVGF